MDMTPGFDVKDKKTKKKKTKSKSKAKSRRKQLLRIRCPICYSHLSIGSATTTRCGHVFCSSCLQKALIMKSECPACRVKIFGARGYHRLYLNNNIFEDLDDYKSAS